MKIKKKNFYYGAALSQIADNSTFTSINKFTEKDGLYRINDYITILIKYSDPESGQWRFSFRNDDIENINWHDLSLVLICSDITICLLTYDDFVHLLDLNALAGSDSIQWISVNFPEGGQMRVRGAKGKLPHLVPHNSFPKDLFTPLTCEKWPPFCKLNFYYERPNLIFSTEDRMLDLADSLTQSMSDEGRTVYLGLSTISHEWKTWTNNNLKKIEKTITDDLKYDGLTVKLERISKIERHKMNENCNVEFVWKLDITEP